MGMVSIRTQLERRPPDSYLQAIQRSLVVIGSLSPTSQTFETSQCRHTPCALSNADSIPHGSARLAIVFQPILCPLFVRKIIPVLREA